LLRPGVQSERSPGIQPLLVRVVSEGPGVKLYVGSKIVDWGEFPQVLKKELRLRPLDWPVYLEGDPDMELGWAVRAIDVIRGLQARVILLTPSDRRRAQ
jgi:hypothetical protein